MPSVATVRDLRNHFPKVKKLVETEGEVLVTDRGEPKYRLVLHTPVRPPTPPPAKDYMARMTRYQPHPMSAAAAKALQAENRGDR